MKQILISLCVAMALPAIAQSQPAKPTATTKASATAAPSKKPKIVVMTRDELRVCLKTKATNSAEAAAINAETADFQKERQGIIASKDALQKRGQELEATAKALTSEGSKLQEAVKEFEKPVPKSEFKAAEARRIEFNDRIIDHQRKVAAFNADKDPYNTAKDSLDASIAANNARARTIQERSEKFSEAEDAWRASCGNRPYDTADEAAVNKELGL